MKLTAYSAISDFSLDAQELLKQADISLEINKGQRPDEDSLIRLVQNYDILIIGAREKMTKRVFEAAHKLKIIGSLSVGLDHIDSSFFRSDKYEVVNTPLANTTSVAEHTFALLLSLKKKICIGNQSAISGTGRKGIDGLPKDISGYTLGIIGAGNIAKCVLEISRAFNMKTLCYTVHPENHADFKRYGVIFVTLEELLHKSDIITIHLPLTEFSRNLINAEKLELVSSTATIINTSRAEIIDIDALLHKADTTPEFSVGLDIDVDSYYDILPKRRSNVIVTPHIAGISADAIKRMDIELATNLIKAIAN